MRPLVLLVVHTLLELTADFILHCTKIKNGIDEVLLST
jgi:hypothetical protein